MPWKNGLYKATCTTSGRGYTLLLRVDLHPDGTRPSYVSADLFLGTLPPGTSSEGDEMAVPLVFISSYRASVPLDLAREDQPTIVLSSLVVPSIISLRFRGPQRKETDGVVEYNSDGGDGVPSGELTFEAVFCDRYFRELSLWIDHGEDSEGEYSRPTTLQAPVKGGTLVLADCWDRAGIRLRLDGGGKLDPQLNLEFTTLDVLRDFSRGFGPQGVRGPHPRLNYASLHLYLMIVGSLADDRETIGAMFDRDDRASTAVFYRTLSRIFPDNPAEFQANYLLTAVHELAHCLNIPHVFDSTFHLGNLSDDSPSYMNYPHRYKGNWGDYECGFIGTRLPSSDRERYQKFWSTFDWNFLDPELMELCHGARPTILVGGIPQGKQVQRFRGDWETSPGSFCVGGDAIGLELQLRVRSSVRAGAPKDKQRRVLFEFGEPIHVEAQLENLIKRPREVTRRLSVLTGDLRITYQTPNGQFHTYHPPATLCALPAPLLLDGNPDNTIPAACHKDVCLNFSADGFGFLEPGLYRLRAAYRHGESLLLSNILEVYVRRPSREDESLLVPLLDDDVADYFAFRGSAGLRGARARLGNAFLEKDDEPRKDITHPLFRWYAACEGRLSLAGRIMLEAGQDRPARKAADHQAAVTFYQAAFGLRDLRNLARKTPPVSSFSNIPLGKLGCAFGHALDKIGKKPQARAWRNRLLTMLAARNVPDPIVKAVVPEEFGAASRT
jgi:hypothetical protein